MAQIKADKPSCDFVLVSGDISQSCTEKSYQLFADTVSDFNLPVFCIPGNHDDPVLLQTHFPHTPVNQISSVMMDNTLIMLVNTQVKQQQYGHVNSENIKQICDLLNNHRDKQAIIVMHHSPLNINSEWMDKIGLNNGDEFIQAVAEHDNLKLILFGHVHQAIDKKYKHIQLFATPSTCYQFKPEKADMVYDNLKPGYRFVKISPDGTIFSHIKRIAN